VTVVLFEPSQTSGAGGEVAQEASPEAADAAAESTAVTIQNFAYNPPTIDVPLGGSVTWSNQDTVPHTATGFDREALQSGTIAAGESFSQTFDAAGTFDYFCEFHPNMKGSIVVE
jgi:plastocyanin